MFRACSTKKIRESQLLEMWFFRFAKQTITWGCFCTKCSNDPWVETQQIFGKVKVHETAHGKVQEWKMSTMKHPTPKLIQIVSRKNQNNSQGINATGPAILNKSNGKQSMPLNIFFFSGNTNSHPKNSSSPPHFLEAPYGYLRSHQQSLKRIHIENAT